MSRLICPAHSRPPFAHQGMQEVCDRLGPSASQNQWVTDADVLRQGVFVSNRRWMKHRAHQKLMSTHMMSVADRMGQNSMLFHLVFERCIPSGLEKKYLPRAGVMVSSRRNLCEFVASLLVESPTRLRGFDVRANGLYWEIWHPQLLYVHPYLDIDISGIPDTVPFHDIFKLVFVAIQQCNEKFALMCDDADGEADCEVMHTHTHTRTHTHTHTHTHTLKVAIFYNRREVRGRFKYSFHLHWPRFVVPSTTTLGAFVHQLALSLPKRPAYDENEDPIPGTESLVDTKPYSNNQQLFRLPFCGKMGDNTAALRPIRPYQTNQQQWKFDYITGDVASYVEKSCTHTVSIDGFTELRMQHIERGPVLPRRDPLPTHGVIQTHDDSVHIRNSWLNFWMPVLTRFVLKNFVVYRQKQMATLSVHAASPDPDKIIIERFERLTNFAASYRVEVHGDNFCEYDHGSTPYHHSGSQNVITYVVDLSKGKIAQQCHKCHPAHLKWRTFIQDGRLTFKIQEDEQSRRESSDSVTLTRGEDPVNFFLSYVYSSVLFCQEKKQLMVYNKELGVWQGGSSGNRLLLDLVDNMNTNYKNYQRARNSKIADEKLQEWNHGHADASEEDQEKAEKKLNDDCKSANARISNLWQLNMAQRTDLIAKLRNYHHPNERERMEPFHHLVPLKDAKCINIYTFAVRDIKPEYYFTSTLNASIIDQRDESVAEFCAWQHNVCCGDDEYFAWKMRIMGLSLTLMNFDRATYIPLGPIGRNGKSSEAALFNDVTMSMTPNRGYNLSREYLTKSSQDKKGANAPDTVLMETSDKCIVIADECRDTPLDGSLIKSFVSGDKTSARNLYESERTTVSSYFTLWIIANTMLKVDCSDSALVNRLRFMPYNAQWVTDPPAVKKKLGFPGNLYVFKEDPYFKERTLPYWKDAMVTKTLYELHLFLKALPRDPENPEHPAKLESFPLPTAVKNYTRERVQREHPLLAFIQNHLGQTEDKTAYVEVDVAFQQFRQYGRNENSGKIKYMNRSQFQEGLTKENIDVEDVGGDLRLSGYYIKKDVINRDKAVDVPGAPTVYIPPAKRPCLDGRDDDDGFYYM
jgi:hypothetical protein